jgi:hypothetical protein
VHAERAVHAVVRQVFVCFGEPVPGVLSWLSAAPRGFARARSEKVMNKTWQLRVCAVYLTLGLPLAASCAREANTLEGDGPSDSGGSSSNAGTTAKAGSGSGKAGTTGAFGGTTGKAGSSMGGNSSDGGEAMADGGDATPTAGSATGGKGGSGGSGGGGVSPDVLARASAIVYYQTSHATASDSTIQMKLFIKNQSDDPLPMASVKIRYWFTAEVTPTLHQYYTGPEAKMPEAVFVDDGADSHALLTFGGGSIVKGGDMNASEVQLEMNNNPGKFDQADDFSWQPTSLTSTPNDKITLYLQDKLIWGCEPSGACFDDDTGAGGAGAGGAGAGGAGAGGAGGAGAGGAGVDGVASAGGAGAGGAP